MTFAGYLAFFFLLLIFIKKGFRSILTPLFCMNMIFIFFFGLKENIELSVDSELLLVFSLLIFNITTFVTLNMRHTKVVNYIKNKEIVYKNFLIAPLKKRYQFYLFLIILFYVMVDFSFNTWLYGSFENAVTRFYFRQPEKDQIPSFLSILLFILYSLSSLIIFILSYNNARFRTSSLYLNLSFLALAIVAFPRGTRGAIVSLLIIIIVANLIVRFKTKDKILGSLFNYKMIFPTTIVILTFLALSSIRNNEIDNLEMLQKTIIEMDFSESQKEYNSVEGDLLLTDYEKCIRLFGSQVDFLPFYYTLKAIIFNPIPRSIWKDKPVGFGVALTEVKNGGKNFSPQYLSEYKWSNAAGIAGEGYANGGVFGVILYSFLLGLYAGVLSKIVEVFLWSDNYISLLISLLSFLATLLIIRGDILSGITQGLYPILFFIFILAIFEPIAKRRFIFK